MSKAPTKSRTKKAAAKPKAATKRKTAAKAKAPAARTIKVDALARDVPARLARRLQAAS